MVPKSEIIATDYQKDYISHVKEEDFNEALKKNTKQLIKLLTKVSAKKANHSYEEGKWTIKQVLQHIIDSDRVFAYRALSFSRGDSAPLPGFDQAAWSLHDGAASRDWKDLIEEFKANRKSVAWLLSSLNDEQLRATGQASGNTINVIGLAFLIPGHAAHHIKILKEKYL